MIDCWYAPALSIAQINFKYTDLVLKNQGNRTIENSRFKLGYLNEMC